MRTSVKIIAGLTVLVLLALVATHQRPTPVTAKKVTARNSIANLDSLDTLKAFRTSPGKSPGDAQSMQPQSNARSSESTAVPALPEPATAEGEWEKKIDDILASESDGDAQKARKLLALLPGLPEDGQVEVVTHASNLTSDDQYAALGRLLTNPRTPTEVLDLLMSDLANRTNTVKLPTLLQVARTADHPNSEEAKNLLELYLENDYGTNWAAWEEAVQAWLKDDE